MENVELFYRKNKKFNQANPDNRNLISVISFFKLKNKPTNFKEIL